jgi:hypothetical protein
VPWDENLDFGPDTGTPVSDAYEGAVQQLIQRVNRAQAAAQPQRLLFLLGASGIIHFWQPVAGRLHHDAEPFHLGWPGSNDTPR